MESRACTGEDRGSTARTIKYTRSKLFEIGRSLSDVLDTETWDFFEHTELDLIDSGADMDSGACDGPASLTYSSQQYANFGRKHSDHYQQGDIYHANKPFRCERELPLTQSNHRPYLSRPMRSGANFATNCLTRMTSSPSIDYNIGSVRAVPATNPPAAGIAHTNLNRFRRSETTHAPYPTADAALSSKMSRFEQSSRMYSSLRRDSDEPMSLPYGLLNDNIHNARFAPNKSNTRLLMNDELGSSPVKRITAKQQDYHSLTDEKRGEDADGADANDNNDEADQDDDDFDVTNLMSITVLSDIRTISRPSMPAKYSNQSFDSKPGVRPIASPLSGKLTRMRSQEGADRRMGPSMRMPSRSKTSLDISYQRRTAISRDAYSNSNSGSNHHHGYGYEVAEYQSLDMIGAGDYHRSGHDRPSRMAPYSHRHHLHGTHSGTDTGPQVAPGSLEPISRLHWTSPPATGTSSINKLTTGQVSIAPSAVAKAESKDSEAAKIIETFKAQVKARAQAQTINSAGAKPTDTKRECMAPLPDTNKISERSDKESDEQMNASGSEALESNKRIAADRPKDLPAGPSKTKESTSTAEEKGSMSDDRQSSSPVTPGRRISSNIPRLIALQKQKSASDSVKTTTPVSPSTPTSTLKLRTTTTSAKQQAVASAKSPTTNKTVLK